MKAIVNTGPGVLEFKDLPTPDPTSGQALIRTGACGICATDLEMISGWTRTGFPAIPGHEWAGTVHAVGPGGDVSLVGQPCVAENVLSDGGEVGFEHPGGYAEFFLTEADRVLPLTGDLPLTQAVLIEPLAVSVRAMRRLCLVNTSGAIVFGDGPIGLLMIILLRRAGVKDLVVVGGREERLRLACELGARAAVNYHDSGNDLTGAVRAVDMDSCPNIIEASGSGDAMRAAMALAGHEGKVLVIGDYGDSRADFRWNEVLHKELDIMGSNASAQAWPEAVRLAGAPDLPLGRLLTHCLPASRFQEGIELLRSRRGDVIKVVLDWQTGGDTL